MFKGGGRTSHECGSHSTSCMCDRLSTLTDQLIPSAPGNYAHLLYLPSGQPLIRGAWQPMQ